MGFEFVKSEMTGKEEILVIYLSHRLEIEEEIEIEEENNKETITLIIKFSNSKPQISKQNHFNKNYKKMLKNYKKCKTN